MNKATTSLIWRTIRSTAVRASRYTHSFQEIAAELLVTVPWYSWPKTKWGDLAYDTILALAYYSPRTVDAWAQKHSQYNVVHSENPWYWMLAYTAIPSLDSLLGRE